MSDIIGNYGVKIRGINGAYWANATPLTLDCTSEDDFYITDDGTNPVARNFTLNFSNFTIGKGFRVKLTADGSARTITWGAAVVASASTLVLSAGKSIILYFEAYNSKMCLMSQSQQF